jgi:hypothetical protein
MWLESSVMAKCLSDEPGSSNASTRSGEALHRHLNSTMRIHLSFKWLREGRCAIHKYSQARAAVQQTQARAAMQHAHARHMQDTRTQARAAMQHTHMLTHMQDTRTQARAAVQHTNTRKRGRLCNTHSQARAAMQHATRTHKRGPLCNRHCNTRAHKRGPLCNTQILTSEGRCLTEHTRTQSEGRCATHEYSQARAAMQHTHSQARAAATHSIDISALSILPGTPRAPRYIYSHSGPIYIASRGCCRGHVCFMRLGCCWGRFRFPFFFIETYAFFIKTYARVYVSAARAAIFLSKVGLLVPSYRPRN